MEWTFEALISTIEDISDTTHKAANLVRAIELVKGDRYIDENDEIAMSILHCAADVLERLKDLTQECGEIATAIEKTTGGDRV